MPEVALGFRAIYGGFLPVFLAFMGRRAIYRKSMFLRTLKLSKRLDSVTVGLLLAYLYLGVFLPRCGDVEVNPGPPKKDTPRQTILSVGAGPASPSCSSPGTAKEPTMSDVMASLHNLTSLGIELKLTK
ncbi:hypothetical protein ACOMHN_065731 [Nucella lapillus]